jgi:hypothetical protein
MRPKDPTIDRSKVLALLIERPAIPSLSDAARVVASNRRMIRKAMRLGHGLATLSKELRLPKRTLQRHLNEMGLFFRKPRTQRGHAVKRNLVAITRAKLTALSNI